MLLRACISRCRFVCAVLVAAGLALAVALQLGGAGRAHHVALDEPHVTGVVGDSGCLLS